VIQRNFPAPAWLDLKTFAPQPLRELGKLAERQCAAGREPFQHAVQAALSSWRPGEPNL